MHGARRRLSGLALAHKTGHAGSVERTARFLPLLSLLFAFAPACPDGGGSPDGGEPKIAEDGGPPPSDGGTPNDAGTEDVAPPVDLEALAEELCLTFRRGLRNAELLEAQLLALPARRCAGDEPVFDVETHPELLELPLGTCSQGDEIRRLFQTALEGGRVEIDRDAFSACLARGRELRAQNATLARLEARRDALLSLPSDPACEGAITPLVEEGGACVQAWDCVEPLRCEADPLTGGALACLPPAEEGEACVVAPPEGQVSARTCEAGTACILGICTRRLFENERCDPAGVPCGEGLVCGPAGTCAPPGGTGAPCTQAGHCEEGLVCSFEGSCQEPALPLEDGAVCTPGEAPGCAGACSVCRPDDEGTHRCLPRGGEGDPCETLDHCREGFFCDADTGACAAERAEGEPCDGAHPCHGGLVCTDENPPALPLEADAGAPPPLDAGPSGPTCHPLPGIGASCQESGPYVCRVGRCLQGVCVAGIAGDPCTGDDGCLEDLLCVEGSCVRAPRPGAPCTADGRCEAGAYCTGDRCRAFPGPGEPCAPGDRCQAGSFCSDGSCEALRPAGAPCTADGQCASGLCAGEGQCATQGASCLTTRDAFLQLVGLGALLPLLLRQRRRAREA